MSIVGEKHFTLMPPHAVLFLEEQQFKSAQWQYGQKEGQFGFECEEREGSNRWVCVNPDLDRDHEAFPRLKAAPCYHVTVKKEEMLYLPSLWYHQVSQCRTKDPYVLALNYWFDMDFSHNYALYETCRALRNFP
jgi:peptidyl-lysine (3S)-dioxygenase / protease